jgi:ABC-2 type transport system ATP-binding protein
MWQIIRELVDDGVTIFLTTQHLVEADQLADRVAVLDRGRIVAEGTPAELKRRIPGGRIELRFAESQALGIAAGLIPNATATSWRRTRRRGRTTTRPATTTPEGRSTRRTARQRARP